VNIGFVCTNYNNSSHTYEALRSLSNTGSHRCRVVVVDNNSDCANVDKLAGITGEFNNVELILNNENLGYFNGLNVGIRHLRRTKPDIDVMIVGNNDLVFPTDFVEGLIANWPLFEKYPVISPDIVTLDGVHQNPHVIHGISRFREFVYAMYDANYFLASAIGKLASITRRFTDRPDETLHQVAQEIEQGYGACYLLSPVFFHYFAELWAPTFMMHEETFLSRQLWEKGLSVYYEPSIRVLHSCHGAMGAVTSRNAWKFSRDSRRIYRHYLAAAKSRPVNKPNSKVSV
jgi:GT2 family glycosyltransferase